MIAALLRRQVVRCLSRQLCETLIRPPTNHSACGGSQRRTASHFLNHSSSPSARRPQNSSGESCASRLRASNSSIDLTSARSENSAGGGKTRSSCRTDSMLVGTEDMTEHTSELQSRQYLVCRL